MQLLTPKVGTHRCTSHAMLIRGSRRPVGALSDRHESTENGSHGWKPHRRPVVGDDYDMNKATAAHS